MMRRLRGIDVSFNDNAIVISESADVGELQRTFARYDRMQRWAHAVAGLDGDAEDGLFSRNFPRAVGLFAVVPPLDAGRKFFLGRQARWRR